MASLRKPVISMLRIKGTNIAEAPSDITPGTQSDLSPYYSPAETRLCRAVTVPVLWRSSM
jgi:hypothetical protein